MRSCQPKGTTNLDISGIHRIRLMFENQLSFHQKYGIFADQNEFTRVGVQDNREFGLARKDS